MRCLFWKLTSYGMGGGQTAIHGNRLPIHIARIIGREERHRTSEFFRLSTTFERVELANLAFRRPFSRA